MNPRPCPRPCPCPCPCPDGPCARSPGSHRGRWGVGTRWRSGPGGSPTACGDRRRPAGWAEASADGWVSEGESEASGPGVGTAVRRPWRAPGRARTTGFPRIGRRVGARSGNSDRSGRPAPRPLHRRRVGRRPVRSAEGNHSGLAPECLDLPGSGLAPTPRRRQTPCLARLPARPVVSGPPSAALPARLTGGAVLEVAHSASTSLLLSSFAAPGGSCPATLSLSRHGWRRDHECLSARPPRREPRGLVNWPVEGVQRSVISTLIRAGGSDRLIGWGSSSAMPEHKRQHAGPRWGEAEQAYGEGSAGGVGRVGTAEVQGG